MKNWLFSFLIGLLIFNVLAQDSTYILKPFCANLNQEVFGARVFQNNIYGVSYSAGSNQNPNKANRLTDLFNISNCTLENAELFSAKYQQNTTINSRFNDGPISGNQNGDFLFFSNNSDVTIAPQMGIFMLNNTPNGWSESISFPLNSKDYSCIHPFYDEQEKRVLFASNMPGGNTKYAIYSISFDGANFGQAQKIEAINAQGNNVFPSAHNGVIYFTSDRPGGMGGMDIYAWDGNKIQLLPEPINSPFDDLAYIHIEENLGFISSNRLDDGKTDRTYFFQLEQVQPLLPEQTSGLSQQYNSIREQFKDTENFFQNNLTESRNNNSFVSQQLIFSAADEKIEESTQILQHVNNNITKVDNDFSDLAKEITALLFNEDLDLIMKKIAFLNQTKELIQQIHATQNSQERENLFQALASHINSFDQDLANELTPQIQSLRQLYNQIDEQKSIVTDNNQTLQELAIASLLIDAKSKNIPVEELYSKRQKEMAQLGVTLAQVQSPKNISHKTKDLIVAQSDTMTILFAFDSYNVSEAQIIKLNQLLFVCQTIPGLFISIEGHTDNVGQANYNLLLSQKRAKSVQNQLVKKGVQDEKFQIQFFGLTKPKESNKTSEGRTQNRRVEIRLVHVK